MAIHLVATDEAAAGETFELDGHHFAVAPEAMVTERDVDGVWLTQGAFDEPVILLHLSPDAAVRFGQLTRENVGRDVAIVVDDELLSMARISREVASGEVLVEPNDISLTTDDVREIARGLAP